VPEKKLKSASIREKKAHVSALNIVLHPHNEDLYIDLLMTIFNLKETMSIRGVTAITLGACDDNHESSEGRCLHGVIYKFIKLDPDEPWYNVNTRSEAEKNEKNSISIPEHLKPHLEEFPFVFYPEGHRIYFISKKSNKYLPPSFLLSFFEKITKYPEFSRFKSIKFTIEPEQYLVDEILSLERIKKLYIDVYQPNPDDHSSAEEKMQARLKSLNSSHIETIYTEADSSGIKPDDETKVMAKIAASNGNVTAKGVDSSGKLKELSTKDHHMSKEICYRESLVEKLLEFSRNLHKSIMSNT